MDFECSVFTGEYVTKDVTPEYLAQLQARRNDAVKNKEEDEDEDKSYYKQGENILALHNNG